MPNFKNNGAGMRGVNVKGGDTVWLEAGQVKSVENALDNQHPDLEQTDAKETDGKPEAPDLDEPKHPQDAAADPTDDDPIANMSDNELRDLIEDRDGERPHHKTGRDKLLAMARG